jgi:GntR family transcriptional regulator
VSQGTVRKAIDELASENRVVRHQGKGTFVATHARSACRFRFLRLTPDGGEAAPMTRRLIDCKRQRAPAEIARPAATARERPGDPRAARAGGERPAGRVRRHLAAWRSSSRA